MRFRLGPYPVIIRWSVLVIGVLVGMQFVGDGDYVLAVQVGGTWMMAIVVAVLTHELGHAVMVRRFGGEPTITVWAFGGFTQWAEETPMPDRRRFLVAAAGSAVQLAIAFAIYGLGRIGVFGASLAEVFDRNPFVFPTDAYLVGGLGGFALAVVVYFGMVWSLFNYLPIRGLDGYHMLATFLMQRMPANRAIPLLNRLSIGIGLLVAAWFFLRGDVFIAFFIVFLTLNGFGR